MQPVTGSTSVRVELDLEVQDRIGQVPYSQGRARVVVLIGSFLEFHFRLHTEYWAESSDPAAGTGTVVVLHGRRLVPYPNPFQPYPT